MQATVAALWWSFYHLPKTLFRFYFLTAARRLYFRFVQRAGRVREVSSPEALGLLESYRKTQLAVSESFISDEALRNIETMIDRLGLESAVRERKQAVRGQTLSNSEYFHLSQEVVPKQQRQRLFDEILPAELIPMLELAHGRSMRCVKVTYKETSPDDPRIQVGASDYNTHPFHRDGNPRFAKLIIYLSDVDEDGGPFEVYLNSRPPPFDELLRIAYNDKRFRGRFSGFGRKMRDNLPRFFQRDTRFWEDTDALRERFGDEPHRVLGKSGAMCFFNVMNVHNGSRDQKRIRRVLHFVFK